MKKTRQIAIDGPVGSGKSTVAKLVAEELSLLYVDTGAMYRGVAWYVKQQGIDWEREEEVVKILPEIKLEMFRPDEDEMDGRNVTVLVNGEDVSWEIREMEMSEGASVVSQYGEVRKMLVRQQQMMAAGQDVIMEGRDIGTRVLPKARWKIYMDASPDERARRKMEQMASKGEKITLEEARDDVETRDNREMNREIDPLRPAEGAWMLDTSKLSVRQVVDKIVEKVRGEKND